MTNDELQQLASTNPDGRVLVLVSDLKRLLKSDTTLNGTDPSKPLSGVQGCYADLLCALGVQGHAGAIAEIKSLRNTAGLKP